MVSTVHLSLKVIHTIIRLYAIIRCRLEFILAVIRRCLPPLVCPAADTVVALGTENDIVVVFTFRIRLLIADLLLAL
jgi:hypothetical protein